MEYPKLVAVAEDQGQLFTWQQARDAGYSAWQIRTRLADGRWRVVLGRVLGPPAYRTPRRHATAPPILLAVRAPS